MGGSQLRYVDCKEKSNAKYQLDSRCKTFKIEWCLVKDDAYHPSRYIQLA